MDRIKEGDTISYGGNPSFIYHIDLSVDKFTTQKTFVDRLFLLVNGKEKVRLCPFLPRTPEEMYNIHCKTPTRCLLSERLVLKELTIHDWYN